MRKIQMLRNWLIVSIALLVLPACGSTITPPAKPDDLTPTQLMNATYRGIYAEPVTLTDGHYEGEPFVAGGASRPLVDYMAETEQFGDLDGDGVEDAVVFLVEQGGGSGSFLYVAAQLNRDGQAVDAGAVLIADRARVRSVTIEGGQVVVDLIVAGPTDPACCPATKTSYRYALQDGLLAEIASPGS